MAGPRRHGGRGTMLCLLAAAVLVLAVAGGPGRSAAAEFLVLAASWQPAFCETRPEKPECTSQTEDRFDASHFALHGLWPQPRENVYCDVPAAIRNFDEAGRWQALPALALSETTRTALDRMMPGSRSALDRHEWVKHGTCYGADPERYFADSLRLLDELNRSAVRDLFAGAIGEALSARDIRAAFDEAFGAGAGRRVHVACRRVGFRRLIVELTINLAGPITADRGLATLMREAPVHYEGCPAGIVDRVGTGLVER